MIPVRFPLSFLLAATDEDIIPTTSTPSARQVYCSRSPNRSSASNLVIFTTGQHRIYAREDSANELDREYIRTRLAKELVSAVQRTGHAYLLRR
jgi:hypothetical protein